MSINNVSSNSMLIESSSTTTESSSSELNSSDFLDLLMIQYQNQDPLEPASDTDFIAQMAEFSALDYMEQMVSSQNSSQMYSMLGQEITYTSKDEITGTEYVYEGTVESVSTSNGVSQLCVNGQYIDLSQVQLVSAASVEAGDVE